jgi:hypothetical protein
LDGGANKSRYTVQPMTYIDPNGLEGFRFYGNWCGPNWTGGHREPYTPNPDPNYYLPPVDMVDKACMNHDICYYYCRDNFPCALSERGKCMTDCDRQLAEASEGSKLPYEMSWARKQVLELWMKYNNSPDPGADGSFCPMSPPGLNNFGADQFFGGGW